MVDMAQAVLTDKLIEECMIWSCDLNDRKGGKKIVVTKFVVMKPRERQ